MDTEGTFRPERIRPIADRFNLEADAVLDNVRCRLPPYDVMNASPQIVVVRAYTFEQQQGATVPHPYSHHHHRQICWSR